MLSSEATLVRFIADTSQHEHSVSTIDGKIDTSSNTSTLTKLVPKVLKHSANNREMAYPYSILESTAGVPLSKTSIYLSIPERRQVDKEVGSMVRSLASLTSPSGYFGTVNGVLSDPSASGANTAPEMKGSKTWFEAFGLLLEGIFRDGEDMAVLLPYATLRAHYQRLSWQLDAVTLPRLLVLDAGNDMNLMVRKSAEDEKVPIANGGCHLTGLRSWSQGIFGDPLLCNAFDDLSEAFLEGWREAVDEVIEDAENAYLRRLIYRCFRAVVVIVTEYYRPQGDSSRRELEGRRTLTSALAELEKVHPLTTDASKRQRSYSADPYTSESEGPKKLKVEKTEEVDL